MRRTFRSTTLGYSPKGDWKYTKLDGYYLGASERTRQQVELGLLLWRGRAVQYAAETQWNGYSARLVAQGWQATQIGDEQRAAFIGAFQLGYQRGFKRDNIAQTAIVLSEQGS